MTLPNERTQALRSTRDFLRRLMRPEATPRVPAAVRKEAYWCLKHFPADFEIDGLAAGTMVPKEVFGRVKKEGK